MDESESSLNDESDESSLLSFRWFFLLSCLIFCDEDSGDDGSGYGSSGTCSLSFSYENFVDCVSKIFSVGRVSGILKIGRTGELIRLSGFIWLSEIVSCSKKFIVSTQFLKM